MLRPVLWLLFCHTLLGQAPSRDPATLARVEGHTFNAVTGEPLRKAEVMLHSAGHEYSVVSDAGGHFLIEKIEPGSYNLTAQHQNFGMLNYGASRSDSMGTRMSLGGGQNVTGLELKLTPFGVISGRVLDQDGDPVTGVNVSVMRWMFTRNGRRLQPAGGGASTNDRGEYRIFNLNPGRYYVLARPLQRNVRRPNVRIERTPESDVTTFYPSAAEPTAAAAVNITPGQEAGGMDIQLRKVRTYSVQGKVNGIKSGHRCFVSLQPHDGRASAAYSLGQVNSVLREDGNFSFQGVTPGRYNLLAMLDNQVGLRQDLTIGDADIEGLVVTIVDPGTVRGKLLFEGTSAKPPKLKGIRVSLTTDDAQMNVPNASAAEDGSFTIDQVSADHYRVTASPVEGAYLKTIRWNGQVLNEGTVDVAAGGSSTLELVYAASTASIEGDVKTPDDQPASAARVLLVPASGRETDFRFTVTDQNGHFSAKAVAPGAYTALATDGDILGMPDAAFMKSIEKETTSVKVDENGRTTTTLKLVPEAKLEEAQ